MCPSCGVDLDDTARVLRLLRERVAQADGSKKDALVLIEQALDEADPNARCEDCNEFLTDETECRGQRGEYMCTGCYEDEYGEKE